MKSERLARQLQFILEIDKLKGIMRRSLLLDSGRLENSAEHSWHLAIMVLVLAEHANEPFDVLHTLKLVLIHDIVEIDAGDTYAYDAGGHADKAERERKAARRIFGLLPAEQAAEMIRTLGGVRKPANTGRPVSHWRWTGSCPCCTTIIQGALPGGRTKSPLPK